jgi:hypothetical protein
MVYKLAFVRRMGRFMTYNTNNLLKTQPLSKEIKDALIKEIRDFEPPFEKSIFTLGRGYVLVDWQKFVELENTWREETPSSAIFDGTIRKLVKTRVMSDSKKGNFAVMKGMDIENPHLPGWPLFFTKRIYAEGYAKAVDAWERKAGVTTRQMEVVKLS